MRPKGAEHAPSPQSAAQARGPAHALGGLSEALWDRLAPIIAALDRPKPTGRPRIDARSTPSCSGCAAARARTYNTTEAPSYGWWPVGYTMLGVHSAQSVMPSCAPR
jgi:hypothetical protein